MTKQELHNQILALVREYCDTYHAPQPWHEGDRLPYASRVYDHEEMENLVDSALEFWLTSGSYVKSFEQQLAAYLGDVMNDEPESFRRRLTLEMKNWTPEVWQMLEEICKRLATEKPDTE